MTDLKTTNRLLLIIVIPIVFYVLKTLDFIFVPLVLSMFIALLFLPMMRWLKKRKTPKGIAILTVLLILSGSIALGAVVVKLSSQEILAADSGFFEKAETKITNAVVSIEGFFGIERSTDATIIKHYFQGGDSLKNFGSTFKTVTSVISMLLMTLFFLVLLLSDSVDLEKIMNRTIFKRRRDSIKAFAKIEDDIVKFAKVKFLLSLFTGIGFGLACWSFGVSFPIFWGLFAFLINFIQMIGSVISVVLLTIFALVEIDSSGTLLFFVLTITAVQVVFGGILEPILMGKTFSLNIVTVLIMLMFWGFIWGVPGLILSIPITVFVKIVMEQFPKTKEIANWMQ